MPRSSGRSSTISSTPGATPPRAGTPGWQPSTHCSASPRSATPSTPPSSPACWPYQPNAATAATFRSSPTPSAKPSSPPPTATAGPVGRDHALMAVAIQTGLRVSELTGLCCQDVRLGTGANLQCTGKGRKQRCTPLTTQTARVLSVWMQERQGQPGDPLFPTSRGRSLSRDAVALLMDKYARIAAQECPTLRDKAVSPHTLRHTCAMNLLHSGVDPAVIALWLGHQNLRSVESYIHADMALKERALARTAPLATTPGRYRPPDRLIDFLEAL